MRNEQFGPSLQIDQVVDGLLASSSARGQSWNTRRVALTVDRTAFLRCAPSRAFRRRRLYAATRDIPPRVRGLTPCNATGMKTKLCGAIDDLRFQTTEICGGHLDSPRKISIFCRIAFATSGCVRFGVSKEKSAAAR